MLGAKRFGSKERRRFVRWHGELPAEFVIFSDMIIPDVPTKTEGTLRDLSATGLRAVIKNIYNTQEEGLATGAVKVGAILRLSKSDQPVKAIGKVVWMSDETDEPSTKVIGIEFSDITITGQDAIKSFVIDFYVK